MIVLWNLLAQSAPASQPAQTSPGPGAWTNIIGLVLVIGVFWWIMSRGQSKQRRQYQEMLAALKKNDRVQTVGGILGTVVDVRDNEVVLKVDETNNVKLRFNRTAIKEVLRDAPSAEEKSS